MKLKIVQYFLLHYIYSCTKILKVVLCNFDLEE